MQRFTVNCSIITTGLRCEVIFLTEARAVQPVLLMARDVQYVTLLPLYQSLDHLIGLVLILLNSLAQVVEISMLWYLWII